MAYESPTLDCKSPQVAATIAMATDGHLRQTHYLLSSRWSGNTPNNHFGPSAVVMSLLTIAATSSLRKFDPATNRKKGRDDDAFIDCVEEFFPWAHIGVSNPRVPAQGLPRSAAEILYKLVRCPLIHSGGMVGTSGVVYYDWLRLKTRHTLPGLASNEENEQVIDDWCAHSTLGPADNRTHRRCPLSVRTRF